MFRNVFKVNMICKRLAGHSKWQNIRHIKGLKDAQRSALFTKIGRQMKIAVQEGNGSIDVKTNPKLEHIVEQAKRANMPQATIQSVLKSCQNDKTNSKPYLLELKGPGSCIILCQVFTSHLHSTKQQISTILRKHNSKYSDGGGMHCFAEKGIIIADILESSRNLPESDLIELGTDHAIEAGAEDVQLIDGQLFQFICGSTNMKLVENNLEKLFQYKIQTSNVEYIPIKLQQLHQDDLELCEDLYKKLESLPEVVNLYDNIE